MLKSKIVPPAESTKSPTVLVIHWRTPICSTGPKWHRGMLSPKSSSKKELNKTFCLKSVAEQTATRGRCRAKAPEVLRWAPLRSFEWIGQLSEFPVCCSLRMLSRDLSDMVCPIGDPMDFVDVPHSDQRHCFKQTWCRNTPSNGRCAPTLTMRKTRRL